MRLIWTETNREKVARHGLTEEDVEAAFRAPDLDGGPVLPKGRNLAEGTVGGQTIRVIFHVSGPEEIYVVTAYRISTKRRGTWRK